MNSNNSYLGGAKVRLETELRDHTELRVSQGAENEIKSNLAVLVIPSIMRIAESNAKQKNRKTIMEIDVMDVFDEISNGYLVWKGDVE